MSPCQQLRFDNQKCHIFKNFFFEKKNMHVVQKGNGPFAIAVLLNFFMNK